MNKRTAATRTATVEQLPRRPAASNRSGQGSGGPHGRRDLILRMLHESARPLSIAEIAGQLGVHPNTARFHLTALIGAGRVERTLGDPAGPGRPAILFCARREMDRNGPSNYRLVAEILTSNLAATAPDPAVAATALGRAWGTSLTDRSLPRAVATKGEAVTQLIGLLDDLGFEPEPDRGARTSQIRLRHCPFLELIDDHADVICPLHLGLMQGALKAMTAPVTVNRLEPFVEPDLCVAHLTSTGASS